jgi:hypothetical protein
MLAGLANPGPIIAELWTDEELEAAVTLDGVVTLVDGRNIMRQLGEVRPAGQPNEAQLQVALADVILLNKVSICIDGCGVIWCRKAAVCFYGHGALGVVFWRQYPAGSAAAEVTSMMECVRVADPVVPCVGGWVPRIPVT